jgi:hypothetical protein
MRHKLRRMSAIVYCLQQRAYTIERLHKQTKSHSIVIILASHPLRKISSMLREEFDCPIERTAMLALIIIEQYDFIAKLTEWVQLYE